MIPRRRLALAAALLLSRAPVARARTRRNTRAPAQESAAVQEIDLPGLLALLRDHAERPLLLHLWATWCSPCLRELPTLARRAAYWRERGVEVISVSLDPPTRASRAAVARTLAKRGPGLTPWLLRLADPDAFVEALDPGWDGSIPALFGYLRGGRPAGALLGLPTAAEVDDLARALLAGPPPG